MISIILYCAYMALKIHRYGVIHLLAIANLYIEISFDITYIMIINVTPPVYLLSISVAITGMYIASYPFSGEIYDIDSASNIRIGLPLNVTDECNISSEVNMSLRLAYVSGIVSLVLTSLLIVYNLTNKNSAQWPVIIVWVTTAISFISQILMFIIITSRVSVWFLSCQNPSKISGACPTTRFEQLKSKITDVEMCYFNPQTLTLRNSESDLFIDCLNAETYSTYANAFSRYDISAYYSARSICKRGETSLAADLSWCYYWGCSRVCNSDAYYINLKWFILDGALLLFILVTYIIIMGEFYISTDEKKIK